MQLLLFDTVDDERPSRVVDLTGRTHHYRHTFVPNVKAGQLYAYRAHGRYAPEQGLRFEADKILLDPYGKCISKSLKSVVADPGTYDWEDDRPPRTPFAKTIIYELHVGNFTRHPNSGIRAGRRGTFAGLIEKLPYLQGLGVTALELLPVFAFDEASAPQGRRNVWGYQPLSFFAPHPGYSSKRNPLGTLDEFCDLVKAAHRAGIEIILDVVYNHAAERDTTGPTLSFRGLANDTYYILDDDATGYAD